jgi:hypothetical protein
VWFSAPDFCCDGPNCRNFQSCYLGWGSTTDGISDCGTCQLTTLAGNNSLLHNRVSTILLCTCILCGADLVYRVESTILIVCPPNLRSGKGGKAMWFWCNSPSGVLCLIFPIIFLVCLLMMVFCMRRFFGGHFGCCSPFSDGWKGGRQNVKPPPCTEAGRTGAPKEER